MNNDAATPPQTEPQPQPPPATGASSRDYERGFRAGQVVATRASARLLAQVADEMQDPAGLKELFPDAPAAMIEGVAALLREILGGQRGFVAMLRAGAHVPELERVTVRDKHGTEWVIARTAG